MSETKDERLQRIHAQALAEFDVDWSAVESEREMCLEDRRFAVIPGAQWEGALGEQFENKPRFEVNKVASSLTRIVNDYRANRIAVDFVSKNGRDAGKLADTMDGLLRSDEQDCSADEAFDNAFEEAAAGGFGAFRIHAEHEDEYDADDDRQRIRFSPIYDADSCVFFDANAKRQDKSDAKRCFVLVGMSKDAYKEEFSEDPSQWPRPITKTAFDWCQNDLVYVAEYYRVDDISVTIQTWENVIGDEERYTLQQFREDPELEGRLKAVGSRLVKTRRVKQQKVYKFILNGHEVLEDCGPIACDMIPIVPVYGKRWIIDGVERCHGHVRLAKDAQRLANMQRSKLGEIAAMSSISKPLLFPEQIAGHERQWAEDNIKNYPFALINQIQDANGNPVPSGPVAWTKSPEIPPAMAALLQTSEMDLKDMLGNTDNLDAQQNMSGVAVELIQNRIDGQTAIHMTNFAKAKKRAGEIWMSFAKYLYAEEGREMKVVSKDGQTSSITIAKPVMIDGVVEVENDIANAKFAIAVTVGPSSSSAKASTVRALNAMQAASTDPETKMVIGAMSVLNMEGEGVGDLQAYFRKKMVRSGVIKPNEQEAQEMAQEAAQRGKTPQDIYLEAAAQEASANAQRAQVDAILKGTQAQQNKVKTAQIAQEIQQAAVDGTLDILEKFTPAVPRAPEVSVVRVANPQTMNPFGIGPATE